MIGFRGHQMTLYLDGRRCPGEPSGYGVKQKSKSEQRARIAAMLSCSACTNTVQPLRKGAAPEVPCWLTEPHNDCHDDINPGRFMQQGPVDTLNDSGTVIFWKLDRKSAGATKQSKGFTMLKSGETWCSVVSMVPWHVPRAIGWRQLHTAFRHDDSCLHVSC
jgi:hypothetical protein